MARDAAVVAQVSVGACSQYSNWIFLGETTKFSRESPKFFFTVRGDVAAAVPCHLRDSFRALNRSSSGLPPKAATQSGQLTWIIVAGLPTAADCYMILLIKSLYFSLLPGSFSIEKVQYQVLDIHYSSFEYFKIDVS